MASFLPRGPLQTIERHILEQQKFHPEATGTLTGLLYDMAPVSYTHLRPHETVLHIVCRLLLEKK